MADDGAITLNVSAIIADEGAIEGDLWTCSMQFMAITAKFLTIRCLFLKSGADLLTISHEYKTLMP